MIELLRIFQTLFTIALIGRIVMSYVSPRGNHPISQLLFQVTEPILGPIRRLLPSMGGFDFSPMIALIVLNLIIGQLIKIL